MNTAAVEDVTTATADEVTELVKRATALPANSRITFVRRVLETLESPSMDKSDSVRHAKSLSDLIGIAAGDNPPPDDVTVKR
jgi:hypothetical protein